MENQAIKKKTTMTKKKSHCSPDFADLPSDVLLKLAAPFDIPSLYSASAACRRWRAVLAPLREATVLLRYGKRFKHSNSRDKALDAFLKAAARGSAAGMVDAGLMLWEGGRKEEGLTMYRKAAEMGYAVGMCNLGICYLQAEQPKLEEAVKWFYQAAESGNPRAQYNLALCLQRGRGVGCNLSDAAKWYVKAAEGGYARAMYNASLCYSLSEGGLKQNLERARKWMKRAADYGHSKAQFEHGLDLLSSGDMMKALVYLELANRAGETAAAHTRDSIMQSLSQTSRDHAMLLADRWKPLKSNR